MAEAKKRKSRPQRILIWTSGGICGIMTEYSKLPQSGGLALKIYKYTVGAMGTNCYLAVDEESRETLVVDPGGEAERLRDAILSKELRPVALLLTHAHFDHLLALQPLRDCFRLPLLLHREDAPLLSDPDRNLMRRFSGEDTPPAPADRLLGEGDTVAFGGCSFRILHTPGHTPGSICLLSEDTLLSGDTLFRESIGRYDFPGGDYDALMRSLERLKALPADYRVLPGHGPSTRLQYEKEHNLYLQ